MAQRKSRRNHGHIRQRSEGSWELRYSAGADQGGKRKVITTTFRGSKRQAEDELTRLRALVAAGTVTLIPRNEG